MRQYFLAAAVGALSLLATVPARADLVLQTGLVGGSGGLSNVVFNPCGLGTQLGVTIQGCLNDSPTTLVNFFGLENLTIGGGGQATIVADDGAFDALHIQLADPTLGFTKLQFNIDALDDGTASFIGVDQFGTVFNFGSFEIDGNGQNLFTMSALNGQVATSFTILSTTPLQSISDLGQVRLGASSAAVCANGATNFPICSLQVVETPEPISVALMGVGLLGLGAARMFRRRGA